MRGRYDIASRNKVKGMVDKKKGIWVDAVKKNEDFERGMKQMWVGIKRILRNQAGEADMGQTGKRVSSSRGEREVLVEHYRTLGPPTVNQAFFFMQNSRRKSTGGQRRT